MASSICTYADTCKEDIAYCTDKELCFEATDYIKNEFVWNESKYTKVAQGRGLHCGTGETVRTEVETAEKVKKLVSQNFEKDLTTLIQKRLNSIGCNVLLPVFRI